MREVRDGLSGPFATAARGKRAPGEALEGSHEPKAMRGECDGQPGPIATAARGKDAPGEVTKNPIPGGSEGRRITRAQGCGNAALASALAPGATLRTRCRGGGCWPLAVDCCPMTALRQSGAQRTWRGPARIC